MGEEDEHHHRGILLSIIDQLRSGTDFHRISLPTFVLEPRSMCQVLQDYFCFNHILQE